MNIMNKKIIAAVTIGVVLGAGLVFGIRVYANEGGNNEQGMTGQIQSAANSLSTSKLHKIELLDDDNALPNIDKESKDRAALVISTSGNVRLFGGTVDTVALASCATTASSTCPASSLTLKLWGMTFMVNIMGDTQMVPNGTSFNVGDKVSLNGMMSGDGKINARKIRNLSAVEDKSAQISAQIRALLDRVRQFCDAITVAQNRPAICATTF
jgi:hypothetical protein